MLTISNHELLPLPKAQAGDIVACPLCRREHALQEVGGKLATILWYTCQGTSFLASVGGQLMGGLERKEVPNAE